jgi:hypothetical protein
LLDRGEYQIDPGKVAARLVDEHLTPPAATPDPSPQTLAGRTASASGATE